MKYNPEKHQRRSIRLREYDYTQVGAYFVTISAHNREPIFGEIVKGKMRLNEWGKVVAFCWDEIPIHFLNVELDAFVIMPTHVHGMPCPYDRTIWQTRCELVSDHYTFIQIRNDQTHQRNTF